MDASQIAIDSMCECAADPSRGEALPMKLPSPPLFGCNTYSYTLSHSADACLAHLADLGFNEIELMMVPGHCWPAEMSPGARTALRRQAGSLGLKITTLNMPNVDMNVAGLSAEMRTYTLDLLKRIVELAKDLEVPGIVIGPGKANPLFAAPKERLTGYFFKALDTLLPLTEGTGTAPWVENMPFAFLPGIAELMAVLDRYGNPDIGIVWDAANSHFVCEDLAASLNACAKRLKLVHLSDTGQQLYRHDPVGMGTVPFAAIPAALAQVGYIQRTMLEIISASPDSDILESAARLSRLGFAAP
jgi:L-ribulose-5-phosphate 3-epimerase